MQANEKITGKTIVLQTLIRRVWPRSVAGLLDTIRFFIDSGLFVYNPPLFGRIKMQGKVFAATRAMRQESETYFTSNHDAIMQMFGIHSLQLGPAWPGRIPTIFRGLNGIKIPREHAEMRQKVKFLMDREATLIRFLPELLQIMNERIDRWASMRRVQLYPEINDMAMDLILRVVVNATPQQTVDLKQKLAIIARGFIELNPNSRNAIAADQAGVDVDCMLESVYMQKTQRPGKDFLSMLIEKVKAGELSKEFALNYVVELIFAGHSTLTSALSSTIALLARPQNRRFAHDQYIESMNYDFATGKLRDGSPPRVAQAISTEAMIHVPPAGATFRQAIEDVAIDVSRSQADSTIIDRYLIPAGTVIGIDIPTLIANKDQEFNPRRWLSKSRERLMYGGGPRRCAGMPYADLIQELWLELFHLRQCRFQTGVLGTRIVYAPDANGRPFRGMPVRDFTALPFCPAK